MGMNMKRMALFLALVGLLTPMTVELHHQLLGHLIMVFGSFRALVDQATRRCGGLSSDIPGPRAAGE